LSPLLLALWVGAVPHTPVDPNLLRRALLDGDLVTFWRGRTLLAERGIDVEVGELGLLNDLARFGLCLPLGPVPDAEDPEYRTLRLLARLERVRLERLLRDGLYRNTPLKVLAIGEPVFQTNPQPQESELVRWPKEEERWPDETSEAPLLRSKCPTAPSVWKESGPGVWKHRQRLRAQAERELYAQILGSPLTQVPPDVSAQVVLAHLEALGGAAVLNAAERTSFVTLLRAGPGHLASPGLLRLGLSAERSQEPAVAEQLYLEVLNLPSRSADEDSRTRVRLVGLLEPRYEQIVQVVDQAVAVRSADRPALDNAKARALYALGQFEALQSFGRRFLDQPRTPGPHDAQTQDLLLRLALKLPPSAALAWAEELARSLDSTARAELFESLGNLALSARNLELATFIFDRLRLEANLETQKRGPKAAAAAARHLVARALVEVERDDVSAFAGLVEELVQLAKTEESRPLARHAPHKELARLDQSLIPRLYGEVESQPGRRPYAGVLLEATVALAPSGGRWRSILEAYEEPLAKLAGPYATGRERPIPKPGPKKVVRQLGEVIIPRLPPLLTAPDHPTELPALGPFLVVPGPDGTLRGGMPWDHRPGRAQ
jgi:hypothetical protein